jgi:uncharacterized damage-inducible protein DinB
MPVSAATLKDHHQYSTWASRRLVDFAQKLTPEELTRDHHTADKSVLGTLVHVFAADRVWLARVQGRQQLFIDPEKDMKMEALVGDWPVVAAGWEAVLAAQTEESVLESIQYTNLKGEPFATPLWQILLHVVNHGTHHRGQVSGFLRAMGHVPPPLDLIFYYRERA